ncbi:hypothetical protein [Prauserella endophytica]|uniref:Uncharacterized protein n=1 Tax=Prauserella endophytica TaxID=1592324 RepID=A0ABY2S0I0_9PSEU|nr:hypothetical protein [Prauserella endophytica]TKG66187.1 hypothetical protein FCN18_25440 [Prauserella endophytica]
MADDHDVVVLTRSEYAALYTDAAAWRELWASEHVRDLLAEWRAWRERRDLSESTAAMAALVDWRAVASAPSYVELQRRRSCYEKPPRTPEQIRAQARWSWRVFMTQGRAA